MRSTLMTTAECLLNQNRNPTWSQAELEQHLKDMLAVRKVLWLPRGLYKDDDTNGDSPEELLSLIVMFLDAGCAPHSAGTALPGEVDQYVWPSHSGSCDGRSRGQLRVLRGTGRRVLGLDRRSVRPAGNLFRLCNVI